MAAQLSWAQSGATLYFSGELDSETVQPLWQQREKAVTGITIFELDGLTRVDTAGLALLIQLVALACEQGSTVRLQGASENLRTLAKLYNLPETLLPGLAD